MVLDETLTERCKRLEHFETPQWAARAILTRELLTRTVIDPCCGTGVLSEVAKAAGYDVIAADIHDWGYTGTIISDWLVPTPEVRAATKGATVLMNPPFSEATDFVKQAFEMDARKIVCFQRFAWWESLTRRDFWQGLPPSRIYVCGERANCWRHDIPEEGRGSSSPTAHAWFLWEHGHPPGTIIGHIWKEDV